MALTDQELDRLIDRMQSRLFRQPAVYDTDRRASSSPGDLSSGWGAQLIDKVGQVGTWVSDSVRDQSRVFQETGISAQLDPLAVEQLARAAYETPSSFFTRLLESSRAGRLGGIAPTTEQAAHDLSVMSKYMRDEQPKMWSQLMERGFTPEKLNDILLGMMEHMPGLTIKDEESRKRLTEAAFTVAMSMDSVARITGKSLDQQKQLVDQIMHRAEVQAAKEMATPEQQTRMDQIITAMGKMGLPIQNLAASITTGVGIRTEAEGAIMSMLGAPGTKMQELLEQAMAVSTEEFPAILTEINKNNIELAKQTAKFLPTQLSAAQLAPGAQPMVEAVMGAAPYRRALAAAEAEGKDLTTVSIETGKAATTISGDFGKISRDLDFAKRSFGLWTVETADTLQKTGVGEAIQEFTEKIHTITEKLKQLDTVLSVKPFLSDADTAKREEIRTLYRDTIAAFKETDIYKQNPLIKEFVDKLPKFSKGTPDVSAFTGGELPFNYELSGVDFGNESLVTLHGKESVVPAEQWPNIFGTFYDAISKNNKSTYTSSEPIIKPDLFTGMLDSFNNTQTAKITDTVSAATKAYTQPGDTMATAMRSFNDVTTKMANSNQALIDKLDTVAKALIAESTTPPPTVEPQIVDMSVTNQLLSDVKSGIDNLIRGTDLLLSANRQQTRTIKKSADNELA